MSRTPRRPFCLPTICRKYLKSNNIWMRLRTTTSAGRWWCCVFLFWLFSAGAKFVERQQEEQMDFRFSGHIDSLCQVSFFLQPAVRSNANLFACGFGFGGLYSTDSLDFNCCCVCVCVVERAAARAPFQLAMMKKSKTGAKHTDGLYRHTHTHNTVPHQHTARKTKATRARWLCQECGWLFHSVRLWLSNGTVE